MPEQIDTKEVLLTFSNNEVITITADLRIKSQKGGFAMFSDDSSYIYDGEEVEHTEAEALSKWLEDFMKEPIFINDSSVYCTNQIVKATVKQSVRRASGVAVPVSK